MEKAIKVFFPTDYDCQLCRVIVYRARGAYIVFRRGGGKIALVMEIGFKYFFCSGVGREFSTVRAKHSDGYFFVFYDGTYQNIFIALPKIPVGNGFAKVLRELYLIVRRVINEIGFLCGKSRFMIFFENQFHTVHLFVTLS